MLPSDSRRGTHRVETLGDETVHALGGTEWGGGTWHHGTQSDVQFKAQELRISGILRLVLSDCGGPWVRGRVPRFLLRVLKFTFTVSVFILWGFIF